ncbi:tRNA glutamyl-Q(34) synthetase GluQRS [Nitrosovibrio sp. Nv4]|uniref:tRNA glutamyl-Q(34) synthetase GluQRS n=1 Tax=Nitrosovibrio sp. Nv4 TaxID=1945880 RepID=UPI000BD67EB4|nr:tRNA glutamyl-Q(34) synthetase GluQRS [Nitrosovibrio sp. Nv4]SOD40996.1 glutamyl-Q tRNA(Asp) synthetase [Nitrosovibrio sp. Nv4]
MTSSRSTSSAYRGRFAPSPTGPLHFGSLVAAVGSYLEARSRHGKWFVRIENLDPLREVPGASDEILSMLDVLGMEWDGEVVYQNQRHTLYKAALTTLERQHFIYACTCSRKEIADSTIMGIDGPVYPGTCRGVSLHKGRPGAKRLRTDNQPIEFSDALQGRFRQRLDSAIGDFVLQRADGVFAYQLAVVVDDAEQGVTHVVRGEDLLNSTPRQIYLQQLLGYPIPSYLHLPVVVNASGEKLSKQTRAARINVSDPVRQLIKAIRFLGQRPPSELINENIASFWKWATENWKQEMIPRKTAEIC